MQANAIPLQGNTLLELQMSAMSLLGLRDGGGHGEMAKHGCHTQLLTHALGNSVSINLTLLAVLGRSVPNTAHLGSDTGVPNGS